MNCGHWKMHNRRVVKRPAGSHEWVELDCEDGGARGAGDLLREGTEPR